MKTQVFDKNHNFISENETKNPIKASAVYVRARYFKSNQEKPKTEIISTPTNFSL